MGMTYREYLAKHGVLTANYEAAEKRFGECKAFSNDAMAAQHAAGIEYDRANEHDEPARKAEYLARSEIANRAADDLDASAADRDRALDTRTKFEGEHPTLETARSDGISPNSPEAPPPDDSQTFREKWASGIETATQVAAVAHVWGQLALGTPEIQTDLNELQTKIEQNVGAPREEFVSATPEHEHTKEPEKPDLDEPFNQLGDEEKITSSSELKEKWEKIGNEWDESNKNYDKALENAPSRPDDSPYVPANDNAPGIRPPSDGLPANDNKPQPDRVVAQGGMPDPEKSAAAIATRPPPANDNNPRRPANDNDRDL